MPLKMYFYLQMLMKLQKHESSSERIRVLWVLRFHFLSSCSDCLKRETRTTGIIRDWILLSSNPVWVQWLCGVFNPTDLSWVSPRCWKQPQAPWRCPSSPRSYWTATRRGAQAQGQWGPPTLTAVLVASLWPLALRNLSLWSLVHPSNKDHCSICWSSEA